MALESLGAWMASHPLLASVLVLAASFYLMVKSSDYIIMGIVGYSKRLGLSDYLIGFLILGVGTSLPEFLSALIGNRFGEPSIVFGTILGSAVTTILVVLGLLAVIGGKLETRSKLLTHIRPFILPGCALPILLAADGQLSRIDGAILLAFFFIFVSVVWRQEGIIGTIKKDVRLKTLVKDSAVFLLALGALLLAARYLVFSSIVLSHTIGIPPYVMAITVIAIGASIGDLAVDIRSLIRGHLNIAIGDILGGLVFESTLILGIIALIKPVKSDAMMMAPAAIFILVPLAWVLSLIKKGAIRRSHGIWLLGTYIAFLIVQLLAAR